MNKLTKIVSGIAVIVVALVVGGVVGKLVFGDNASSNASNASQASSIANQPASTKTDQLTTILANPQNYLGKEVKVTGNIYIIDGKKYSLVEPVKKLSKNDPNSLQLDLSKSKIDPSKYAVAASTTQKTAGNSKAPKSPQAVTLTGKFTQVNKQYILDVDSLKT